MTKPVVLTMDFRAPAVPDRLGFLAPAADGPYHLVELKQSAEVGRDLAAHVDALIGAAALPAPTDVTIVTYCASFALIPQLTAALESRGHRVAAALALEPSVLDEAEVWTTFEEVSGQLGATGRLAAWPDGLPPRAAIRADLAGQLGVLMAPLRELVRAALGVDDPDSPTAAIADELVARYDSWLGHALACYAAGADAPTAATRLIHTVERDPRDGGVAEPLAEAARQCRDWDELIEVTRAGVHPVESGSTKYPKVGRLQKLLPPAGPGRLIALAALIASAGFGLYAVGSAIYFVESAGLSVAEVGLGLGVAALIAFPLGVPLGHLADRVGPREVAVGVAVLQAVLLTAATQVTSFWTYLLVIIPLGIAEAGGNVVRSALITGVMGREGRVALSAYLRSLFNAGMTLGIGAAGLAIAWNTRSGYAALMLGNAATACLVAVLYLRLPRVPGRPAAAKGTRKAAVRDVPYLLVGQIAGLLGIAERILAIGLPLWVLRHTSAPRGLAAWLVGINTVLVVLLQVRATRRANTLDGAAQLQTWGFAAMSAACVIAGLSGGLDPWLASAVLVAAVALLSLGEIWTAGAGWALRYELAPEGAQGQYGGAFQLGNLLPAAVGPAMVALLTDEWGLGGWLVLAGVFLVGLLASGPAIAWARRTRVPAAAELQPA